MSIQEKEQRIRDFINEPRRSAQLVRDSARWNSLCSALDVIGDAELALDAYLGWSPVCSPGQRYIIVYGVLQVLCVEQDAANHVGKVLSDSIKLPTDIRKIREIRAASIGHPISRKQNNSLKSSFIRRHDLTQMNFSLMEMDSRGSYEIGKINLPELILRQREFLEKSLDEIIEVMRKEEMQHRTRYRNNKLVNIFPKSLGYSLLEICVAARSAGSREFVKGHLEGVEERMTEFEEALKARGEWEGCEEASSTLQLTRHSLQRLRDFFGCRWPCYLHSVDAHIFAVFLKRKIEDLKIIAAEFDKKYDTDPELSPRTTQMPAIASPLVEQPDRSITECGRDEIGGAESCDRC